MRPNPLPIISMFRNQNASELIEGAKTWPNEVLGEVKQETRHAGVMAEQKPSWLEGRGTTGNPGGTSPHLAKNNNGETFSWPTHIKAFTYTLTTTHACSHTDTHAQYSHAYSNTHSHILKIYRLTYALTHRHTQICSHIQSCAHTYLKLKHTHTYTHILKLIFIYKHLQPLNVVTYINLYSTSHTQVLVHIYIFIITQICSHICP